MRAAWAFVITAVLLSQTVQAQQTFSYELDAGWNMIGSPFADGLPLPTIEQNCEVQLVRGVKLWQWNALTKTWATDNVLRPGVGYWIRVADACTFSVSGLPSTLSSIQLQDDWNLVSTQGQLSAILNTCDGKLDTSYLNNAVWNYDNGGWTNPTTFDATKAYWFNVRDGCNLLYSPAGPPTPVSPGEKVVPASAEACPVGVETVTDIQYVRGIEGVAVDDTHVYWLPIGGDKVTDDTQIMKIPKSGGDATNVAPASGIGGGFLINDGYIYWSEGPEQNIKRVKTDGTGIQRIRPRVEPGDLAVDGEYIYYGGNAQFRSGGVFKVKKDGSGDTILAGDANFPNGNVPGTIQFTGALDIDNDYVYYTASAYQVGNGIFKVAKTGGVPRLIATTTSRIVEADSNYIYYTETAQATGEWNYDANGFSRKSSNVDTDNSFRVGPATVRVTALDGEAMRVTVTVINGALTETRTFQPARTGGYVAGVNVRFDISGGQRPWAIVQASHTALYQADKNGLLVRYVPLEGYITTTYNYRGATTQITDSDVQNIVGVEGLVYLYDVGAKKVLRFNPADGKIVTVAKVAGGRGFTVTQDHQVYWAESGWGAGIFRSQPCRSDLTAQQAMQRESVPVPENQAKFSSTQPAATCPTQETTIASGLYYSSDMALSAEAIYWGAHGGKSYYPAPIMKIPKTGGTPTVLAGTDKVTSAAGGLVASDGYVYWGQGFNGGITNYGSVKRIREDGTDFKIITPTAVGPLRFTSDAQYVYWYDSSASTGARLPGDRIYRFRKDLSEPKTLIATNAGAYVIDETYVYFTRDYKELVKASKAGGETMPDGTPAVMLVRDDVRALDQDKTHIYYTNSSQTLKRIGKNGGEPQIILNKLDGSENSLFVKGDYVYYIGARRKVEGDPKSDYQGLALYKVQKTGGIPAKISDIVHGDEIIVDGNTIYVRARYARGYISSVPDCRA